MESPLRNGQWMSQMVGRFEGPLVQYATRLLGGDVDRARDVVQDTFLKLWQAPAPAPGGGVDGPDLTVNGHLAAWLYRVCRNRCMDVRRKERRMTTLIGEHEDATRCDEASGVGTGQLVGCDSNSVSVMALLESLPQTQQEAVRLKFQGGLSYAEIAQVMEITANHVGVLIHTALKTIRERLGNSEIGGTSSGGTGILPVESPKAEPQERLHGQNARATSNEGDGHEQ